MCAPRYACWGAIQAEGLCDLLALVIRVFAAGMMLEPSGAVSQTSVPPISFAAIRIGAHKVSPLGSRVWLESWAMLHP